MGAVQDAAVDADLILADAIFEPPPVEEQRGRHEQEEQDRAEQGGLQPARNGEIAEAGVAARHPAQRSGEPGQQEERMEMLRRSDRRIVRRSRFGHVRG